MANPVLRSTRPTHLRAGGRGRGRRGEKVRGWTGELDQEAASEIKASETGTGKYEDRTVVQLKTLRRTAASKATHDEQGTTSSRLEGGLDGNH